MTTVARQITVSSHRMAPSPPATTQTSQNRGDNGNNGIKSYIFNHDKDDADTMAVMRVERNGSTGKKTKSVRIADDANSPPPPLPPTRTTSVVQQTNAQSKLPDSPNDVAITSSSGKFSESLTLSSSGGVVTSSISSVSDSTYTRQRSNTGSVVAMVTHATEGGGGGGGGGRGNDDAKKFNTIQGRSHSRLNPNATPHSFNAGSTGGPVMFGRGMHGRFSTSQPHLHRIDQQATIVMPNDRIKKSMFDADSDDEQDGNWGEDYGSGYVSSLMKISHGEIQKHAVAVTTPIAPPIATTAAVRRNRAGSDPNLLDTMTSPKSTTTTTADPEQQREEKSESPVLRERSSSLISSTASSSEATAIQTTPIARAYREHLMEKMDKERQGIRVSPSSSSVSSGESPVTQNHPQPPPQSQQQQQVADALSSKMQSITASQLQSLDMPDRACLPRILPPTGTVEGKQEKWSKTLENGGYPANPFLAHSSSPQVPGFQSTTAHTGFSYGTLPRKRPSLPEAQPQVQGHMMGKSRTQSVNDLHAPPHHGGADFPDNPQSTVEQMSAYFQSHHHVSTDNLPPYSSSQEAPSAAEMGGWSQRHTHCSSPSASTSNSSSQSSATIPYSPGIQTDGNGTESRRDDWTPQGVSTTIQSLSATPTAGGSNSLKKQTPVPAKRNMKPAVLPKPSNRKNGNAALPSSAHERSTSDPSLKYGGQVSSGNMSPSQSPIPLTPFPKTVSSFDADSMQLRQPPYNQSVQYGRPQKHRFHSGVQQLSTSLLEIQEADEMEERDLNRMSTFEVKLFDYVSLNSALLPKRVRISKGFCSDSTEVTMSQGEEFDLHFVQEVKSALVVDPNAIRYSVPLNTVARFSIVYDPFEVERVAVLGFHFRTAGVIMDLKNPPIVVAATQAFDGGRIESSVEEGEILVMDGVKNVFHGRLLKVFSLKYNTVKHLDEKCLGNFTTNPEMIKMSLSQVYESSIPLPQKVVLTPADTIPLPTTLRSNFAILKQFMMVKSVVATTLTESTDPVPSDEKLLAVSVSLDLDVELIEVAVSESQLGKLREETKSLLGSFEQISVIPYMDMPTSTSYVTQCALLSNLDPKSEDYSTEIVTPNCVTSPRKMFQIPFQNSTRNAATSSRTMPPSGSMDTKTHSRIQAMEGKYEKLESKVTEMTEHIKHVASKVDQIHTYLRKAQDAMTKHKKLQEEVGEEQKMKKSTTSSSSTLPRASFGSSSSQQQQQQQQHRMVSRSYSDGITGGRGVTSAKNPTLGRSGSKQSNISRTDSSKYASESESIDGGDPRVMSDEVFTLTARPASSSSSSGGKPPVLPKPKGLKKSTNGKLMQKLKALKVTGRGKLSLKKDMGSDQSTKTVSVSKVSAAKGEYRTEADKEVAQIVTSSPSLQDSLEFSTESIDLKEFLIETAPTAIKPKLIPKPAQAAAPPSSGHTPLTPANTEVEIADVDTLIGDDLTDWCLQVEDELTQLYNESILSSM